MIAHSNHVGLTRTIYSVDYDSLRKHRRKRTHDFGQTTCMLINSSSIHLQEKTSQFFSCPSELTFGGLGTTVVLVKVSSWSCCGKKHESAKLTMKSLRAIFKRVFYLLVTVGLTIAWFSNMSTVVWQCFVNFWSLSEYFLLKRSRITI